MNLQKTKMHNPPYPGLTLKEDILPSVNMIISP